MSMKTSVTPNATRTRWRHPLAIAATVAAVVTLFGGTAQAQAPVPQDLIIDGVDGSTEPSGKKVYTIGDLQGSVIIRNSRDIVVRGQSTAKPYTCNIHPDNDADSAVSLYNVQNVTIENCELHHAKHGIWADTLRNGVYASSSGVTIRNNHIHDVFHDGMQFKIHPDEFSYNYAGTLIEDNHIAAWGEANFDDFLYHGIYMKAADAVIQDNYFSDGAGGDAITIRTAGIVRRNVINDPNDVGGISYYSQIDSRVSSGHLRIESNIVYSKPTTDPNRQAIGTALINLGGLGGDSSSQLDYMVSKTTVRFNTLVLKGPDGSRTTKALQIDPNMAATGRTNEVAVFGNLLVDTRTTPNLVYGTQFADYCAFNAETGSTAGLVTSSPDPTKLYRLNGGGAGLINQISPSTLQGAGQSAPTYDVDIQNRPVPVGGMLDIGADEWSG